MKDAARQTGGRTITVDCPSVNGVTVSDGQILYGGDDLSGEEWDHRDWQSRSDVRENLFWLAAEACLRL